MVTVNDFVILTKKHKGLEINSVGIVKKVKSTKADIFFIGKRKEIEIELTSIKFLDTTQTGRPKGTSKEFSTKICNVCHILKPIEEFDLNQNAVAGKTRRPTCKDCRKHIDGVSLRSSEKKRMEAIKPKMFFVCPICKKASIPNVTANIVIDHDHETGNAREWICDSCNTGLGRFKDNIELIEEAIKYLKKHNIRSK
ncbi:endonuclease VII domain-containing protein [Capnocytophaga canimorsus]|uniref:endonuclease VII domain-containing protein n=1 Tax=Capnocytophaga canimorsus TaxID=28188 RepID=UPI00385E9977